MKVRLILLLIRLHQNVGGILWFKGKTLYLYI